LKDGKLHIDASSIDPASVAFGFGRRVCPGRYFAQNSLFIIISSVLAAFNIAPPLDGEGRPIKLTSETTIGMIS
jgi:cytochrome P450